MSKQMKRAFGTFAGSLRSLRRALLAIAIAAVLTLVISAIVYIWLNDFTDLTIPSIGVVRTRGVEAYWDSALKNKTEKLDWGTIWAGESKNATLYLRSTSDIETTLILETGNWTFRDSDNQIVSKSINSSPYLNLTWNCTQAKVRPGEILQVTLVLSVERSFNSTQFLITNNIKAFSFDIIIRADR